MPWYKLTKHFQGGNWSKQIFVPPRIKLGKDDWEAIMEYVGEHTDGGHSAGYRIYRSKLKAKSPKLDLIRYPANLCDALLKHGKPVTTTRMMIG